VPAEGANIRDDKGQRTRKSHKTKKRKEKKTMINSIQNEFNDERGHRIILSHAKRGKKNIQKPREPTKTQL
jgi:hypothetical protein